MTMINDTKLAAQLKKDAKGILMVRNVDENLFISNRHYAVTFPAAYLGHLPKTQVSLASIFGEQFYTLKQNVHINNKSIGECTVDFSKIIPENHDLAPAEITPMLYKHGKDMRVVTSDGKLSFYNEEYIQLADIDKATAGTKSDILSIYNETCKFIIMPYRVEPHIIERIKSYFK